MELHPGPPGQVGQAAEVNALFSSASLVMGCRKADGEAWFTAAAWHFCIWGIGMFWTFYGAREDRRVGWPAKATRDRDPAHNDTCSARKTVERLFFIIEDLADIGADKPSPTAH